MTGVRSAADIVAGSQRFLNWWAQELMGMLPTRSAGMRTQDTTHIIVSLDGEAPEVLVETPKQGLALFAATSGSLSDHLREALSRWPKSAVRIRVGEHQCFKRTTLLPAGAHREYGQILDLELERDTPFPAGSTLGGYRLVGRPDRQGMQQVEHFVVKKTLIEDALNTIRQVGGIPDGVDCWDTDRLTSIPILLPLQVTAEPKSHLRRRTGLMALIIALSVSATWQLVARQHAAITELEAQAAFLTPSAEDAIARAEAVRKLVDTTERLIALREMRLPASVVLDRVTRALPDNTWIDAFKIDHDSIEISGFSQAASALLPLLESAACCSDVRLLGPVRYDADHDRERFQIKARILLGSGKPNASNNPNAHGPQR